MESKTGAAAIFVFSRNLHMQINWHPSECVGINNILFRETRVQLHIWALFPPPLLRPPPSSCQSEICIIRN